MTKDTKCKCLDCVRERKNGLKIGKVIQVKNNSWICMFGCHHNIQENSCDCDCHNKFKIKLHHHQLGSINMIGVRN